MLENGCYIDADITSGLQMPVQCLGKSQGAQHDERDIRREAVRNQDPLQAMQDWALSANGQHTMYLIPNTHPVAGRDYTVDIGLPVPPMCHWTAYLFSTFIEQR